MGLWSVNRTVRAPAANSTNQKETASLTGKKISLNTRLTSLTFFSSPTHSGSYDSGSTHNKVKKIEKGVCLLLYYNKCEIADFAH